MYWLVSYERDRNDEYMGISHSFSDIQTEEYLKKIKKFNLFDMQSRRRCKFGLELFIQELKRGNIKNVWLKDGCTELFSSRKIYLFGNDSNILSAGPVQCILRNISSSASAYREKNHVFAIEYSSDYLVMLDYLGREKVMSFDDAATQLYIGCNPIRSNLCREDLQKISKGRSKDVEESAKLTYIESSKAYVDKIEKAKAANQVVEITSDGGYHIGSNGVLTITGNPESIVCRDCWEILVDILDYHSRRIKIIDISGKCKTIPRDFADDCRVLEVLRLPSGIQRIGDSNFNNTLLEKLDLRMYKKLRTIGWETFSRNRVLKEAYLPDNLGRILQNFSENPVLETILLPKNMVEMSVFTLISNPSLKRLGLPAGDFRIDGRVNEPCSNLSNLEEIYATKKNYDRALEIVRMAGHNVKIIVGDRA